MVNKTSAIPVRRGQRRTALVGLVVSAALAAAAFAGHWIVTRESSPTASASTGAPSSLPTPASTITAAPIPTAAASTIVANHEFKSQSGNLRCSVGQFSGKPGAICQQVNINYPIPSGSCPSDLPGVFVGVGPSGAYWPCVAHFWPDPAEVIAYDTPVTQSGVTCTINLETGVRCVNEDGNGFTMEYDAGISTF